jgi:hypothetical protein
MKFETWERILLGWLFFEKFFSLQGGRASGLGLAQRV